MVTTTLYNASGSAIPNIAVNRVDEIKNTRTVIHDLPGVNQDIIQNLGSKNRKFTIRGWAVDTGSVSLSTARDDLQYLEGTTGSISSNIISQTQVFYSSVRLDDRGSRPMEFIFKVEAVEVI